MFAINNLTHTNETMAQAWVWLTFECQALSEDALRNGTNAYLARVEHVHAERTSTDAHVRVLHVNSVCSWSTSHRIKVITCTTKDDTMLLDIHVAQRKPTTLCTMFGLLLGWYTIYTFSGALAV